MEEFSCKQKKKIQYNHSSLEMHYFAVFTKKRPRSEPAVVARLGLPDFAEFVFIDIV